MSEQLDDVFVDLCRIIMADTGYAGDRVGPFGPLLGTAIASRASEYFGTNSGVVKPPSRVIPERDFQLAFETLKNAATRDGQRILTPEDLTRIESSWQSYQEKPWVISRRPRNAFAQFLASKSIALTDLSKRSSFERFYEDQMYGQIVLGNAEQAAANRDILLSVVFFGRRLLGLKPEDAAWQAEIAYASAAYVSYRLGDGLSKRTLRR